MFCKHVPTFLAFKLNFHGQRWSEMLVIIYQTRWRHIPQDSKGKGEVIPATGREYP
jgi:hypothetical protein